MRSLVLLLFILAMALVGCQSPVEKAKEAVAEKITEKAIEQVSGGDIEEGRECDVQQGWRKPHGRLRPARRTEGISIPKLQDSREQFLQSCNQEQKAVAAAGRSAPWNRWENSTRALCLSGVESGDGLETLRQHPYEATLEMGGR